MEAIDEINQNIARIMDMMVNQKPASVPAPPDKLDERQEAKAQERAAAKACERAEAHAAAVIIQAFLRKDYRERQEAKAQARAAAKARKRAKAKARRERACEHLVGEWVCLKADGDFEESKHFLGFEVYSAGDGSPFLYYRETDSDEYLVFEYYESGDRIRAWLDGDILKWSDGTVYYRAGSVLEGREGCRGRLVF